MDVKNLVPGDEVFWTDPDEGLCSRTYQVNNIVIECEDGNYMVTIYEKNGDTLQCWIEELS